MKIVTLLSGGLDSSLLSYLLKEEGHEQIPLYVNYGQINLERELSACRQTCKNWGLDDPIVLDVSNYGKQMKSGLTNKSLDIVNNAFLPNRNALFLLIAASFAYQHSCNAIAIGLLNEDCHIFPDQTRYFLDKMEEMLTLSLGRKRSYCPHLFI